jgi:pimeloyl-ACP methyl ester carboxylesterase
METKSETQFLQRGDERIAFDLQGDDRGPLVVCVPGMGDLRAEYRFLVPMLVKAGYRVATMDVRGHGESSVGWDDYSAAAVGSDVVALVKELGTPAFLVGTSMAGGAAVWAAAEAPASFLGMVLIGPFVRDIPMSPVVRGLLKVMFGGPWARAAWSFYYKSYPSSPPSDLTEYRARLGANLCEPGRLAALRAMLWAKKADCEARLQSVHAPALVLMGSRDPDFKDPRAEAEHVASRLKAQVWIAEDAGHYPHAEQPVASGGRILEFLRAHG